MLPTLDAHAPLGPARTPDELAGSGAVLAVTLSLDEAARVLDRQESLVAWGVGCHLRLLPGPLAAILAKVSPGIDCA